jgi:hypothetical protein
LLLCPGRTDTRHVHLLLVPPSPPFHISSAPTQPELHEEEALPRASAGRGDLTGELAQASGLREFGTLRCILIKVKRSGSSRLHPAMVVRRCVCPQRARCRAFGLRSSSSGRPSCYQ